MDSLLYGILQGAAILGALISFTILGLFLFRPYILVHWIARHEAFRDAVQSESEIQTANEIAELRNQFQMIRSDLRATRDRIQGGNDYVLRKMTEHISAMDQRRTRGLDPIAGENQGRLMTALTLLETLHKKVDAIDERTKKTGLMETHSKRSEIANPTMDEPVEQYPLIRRAIPDAIVTFDPNRMYNVRPLDETEFRREMFGDWKPDDDSDVRETGDGQEVEEEQRPSDGERSSDGGGSAVAGAQSEHGSQS